MRRIAPILPVLRTTDDSPRVAPTVFQKIAATCEERLRKIVGVAMQQEDSADLAAIARRIAPILPVLRTTDDSPARSSGMEREFRRIVGATRGRIDEKQRLSIPLFLLTAGSFFV
jgi:hypothetical protein